MTDLQQIQRDRQKVYGDPQENHRGIAQAWAGLLQPHAAAIEAGTPIPEWTVALMMCALKLNRMRRVYKEDNFDDLRVYLGFAETWQKGSGGPERVYVASAYSAPTLSERESNVARSVKAATEVMRRGHEAHSPLAATHPIEVLDDGKTIGYEDYMRQDLSLIGRWSTVVLRLPGPSKGADREVAYARANGIRVIESHDELPDLRA